MIELGVWQKHRIPVEHRLRELARWAEERGLRLELGERAVAGYVFFGCRACSPAGTSGWVPILRSQVAGAVAETVVGPLTTRWLNRLLAREARARNYPLGVGVRERALQMARQFVEPPPQELAAGISSAAAAGSTGPGSVLSVDPADGAPALTGNLLRWRARLARLLLEAMTARPQGVVVEAVAYFSAPSYVRALRRAAAASIAELAAEREEQRAAGPWRSLWLGPPPRAYEVHLFRAPNGGYHLLDRWGAPAGRRWLGDGVREAPTEEVVVGHLVRLGPRRIVVHLPDEAPVQAAVRAAFPGRVHTCHGCPRCMTMRRTSQVPTPSR